MSKNKIDEKELIFRKVKEKERLTFYQNAMLSVNEFATSSLGFSWKRFKRILMLNRLTFGLIAKIFMKDMVDYAVVYDNKMVAGFTILTSKENYALGNVFTIPEYRGKGLASIIVNKVTSEFSDKPIELNVDIKNEIAIHIYKKYGFKEKNRTKQFIENIPFQTKPFAKGYSAKILEYNDLENLDKLRKEIPQFDVILKAYKRGLKKSKKRALQIETQVPCALLEDNEIIGLGRAVWSKTTPHTATILASAILPEGTENYASFITFITTELIPYDIKKFNWNLSEKTKPFENSFVSFLSKPVRESIVMEKEIEIN
ncbi:MAG: GNAT family N-acetyltransferase [Asgard group archaeon]|nr:GNAT family N-acetyltransferase [Asgard group archaeon]